MLKTACGNGFPLNIPSVIPESGGSGGTSDYSELSNKPQINSVTLSGNKSAADLGLASADIEDLIPADASSSNQLATAADLPSLATTSAPGLVQPDGATITIADGVISAVGGSSGETYSDTETVVGTWLGETLYRKVIDCGTLPNNGYTRTATGLDSAAHIVQISGSSINSNGEVMGLPFASDTAQYNIPIKYTGNTGANAFKIEIYSAANYSAYTDTKVVIDYIKTV